MNTESLKNLPSSLINETGMSVGVCIWRDGDHGDHTYRKCSVGEFLSRPENQSGDWYIDGGWGGPPGPIRVQWILPEGPWINLGFPPWR